MADYPILTPPSLDGLDKATPASGEDASKLDDAIRQVKSLVVDVFVKEHNADGTHKSTATSLDPNSITGDKISHSSSDDTLRAISVDHIKDGSVTESKLSLQSIAGEKLKNGSVTEEKLADQAVSGAKVKNNTLNAGHFVGGTPVGAGSIGNQELKPDAVTNDKVKDQTIGAEKLNLPENLIPVGTAGGTVAAQVGGALSITEVDGTTNPPTALFQLLAGGGTVLPIAVIQEVGTAGGGSLALTWNRRPVTPSSFSLVFDAASLIQLQTQSIIFRLAGTYLVFGQATAFKTAGHQIRLRKRVNNSGTLDNDFQTVAIGSLVDSPTEDPPAFTQTISVMMGLFILTANETEVIFEHYTAVANTGDGLGRTPNAANGEPQVFAQLVFFKLA